ncbi:MAG: hypothetical protein JSS00_15720 [Proteobacteria bacterium]|nr:hypothetical protein [Pseudomonadota bacterium]
MSTRRLDDFTVAACDGGFAIAAFGCGLFDAPLWLTGLVAFAMLAYWSWSRRRVLNRLHGAIWASQTALAVSVIIAILAGSYWLGLNAKDLIT